MTKQILKDIYFVGYVDWSIRDFHSFETRKGVTYNSYLIRDEKNILIDTVKAPFFKNLINNIQEIIPLDEIDYIVVNHAEPDHAGALKEMVNACKNAILVCTQKCKDILAGYNDISDWKFTIVKTNDILSIGKRSLEFIETPMVHWPDSMFTYIKEDKALFSMDAFGQHYSSSNKFDDEVDFCEVMEEAKKYYANIIMLYGKQVSAVLEKASKYDIELIIPAHGVIWRKYIKEILQAYNKWVNFIAYPKVLIIYDTMWQSTKLMAEAIYKGVSSKNVEAKLIYARSTGITEIATDVLDAAVVAFGSATMNMGMLPQMGAILTYLKGLSPQNKAAALFGSFGWGKGAVEDMASWLETTNFDVVARPIKVKWRPTEDVLNECMGLGKLLADKALEISEKKDK